jgi:predicted RND superfamily exporter protein
VLAAFTVVTALACFFIPHVRLQLDARSLVPADSPELADSDRAARLFRLRDVVVIGVVNNDAGVYTRETLSRVARIGDRLSRLDAIEEGGVMSLATAPRLEREGDRVKTSLMIAPGAELNEEEIRRIRREAESSGLANGILVAPDGRAAAVFAEVEEGADRYSLLGQVRQLIAEESGGADALHLTGTALAQAVLGESAARDLARLIPAVIAVVGLVLALAFRHPAPALMSLTEIAVSLILTVGLMGLFGESVFVTTLVMPVILVSVGVSDDVYVLTHYFNEARARAGVPVEETVASAFGGLVRPVSLTAATTVTGLLSMAVTGLESLQVFGVYGAVAILFSTLCTFTLIPALIVVMRPRVALRESQDNSRDAPALKLLGGLIAAGPRNVLLVALIAASGAALLLTRLRVDDSWVKNLPEQSDIARGDRALNEALAGTMMLDFMIDVGREGGWLDPQAFAALGAVEEALTSLPFVGAAHSLYSDVTRARLLRGR